MGSWAGKAAGRYQPFRRNLIIAWEWRAEGRTLLNRVSVVNLCLRLHIFTDMPPELMLRFSVQVSLVAMT